MNELQKIQSVSSAIAQYFDQHPAAWTFLLSMLLLSIYYITRQVVSRNIDKKQISKTEKLFLKKKFVQYLNYFALLILFMVWFSKLQVFFVSLFAVAAAIVIAFKELIMCLTGGMLIKSSKPFKVGHRIELGETRGFVIQTTWTTTKVLEIGPEKYSQQTTGDIITIPNSLMLSHVVKNQSYFNGYSVKAFRFEVKDYKIVEKVETYLVDKATTICKPYLADAKDSINKFCKKENISIPALEPRGKIILSDEDGDIVILVKMPVHNSMIADVEQSLNRAFVELMASLNQSPLSHPQV